MGEMNLLQFESEKYLLFKSTWRKCILNTGNIEGIHVGIVGIIHLNQLNSTTHKKINQKNQTLN